MERTEPGNEKLGEAIAYAAPVAGSWFFYIPMWSILPGIYGKYFGIPLTTIASIILCIRLFDGVIDTTVGYLSDWHRACGGSRKPWVVTGTLGSIFACYFLFNPPANITGLYYLIWSIVYFLMFTLAEIPHLTWGSELTPSYQWRAHVYGVRNIFMRSGMVAFYMLPLLPMYSSSEYTPQVLRGAVAIGAALALSGLVAMLVAAPAGTASSVTGKDSFRSLFDSLLLNRPLLIYFAAFGCVGLCYGMWFALIYIYLDSYLQLGDKAAGIFLTANIAAVFSTPLWLRLIRRFGKSVTWAIGVTIFILQLLVAWVVQPGTSWWISLLLVLIANLCFCCHDVAAMSILGDIVDYGRLKFQRDRGTTYFALNTLVFKIGLGIGGGVALGLAGIFGFDPSAIRHVDTAVFGLKLAFVALPVCFAIAGLLIIVKTPITQRKHEIIRRRISSRANRDSTPPLNCPDVVSVPVDP
jgi:glycoside/pentoside/hexuronide:cation symporter, GPH family